MSEKISVIVPVYNVEAYLERCVKSILAQTYQYLEILLVNDGSTDKSGKLCDELAKRDERIRVIHKENGGVSDARNVGKKEADGQYILFIDPDDYIHPEMISSLHRQLINEKADISVCGVMNDYVNNQTPQCENTELYFTCDRKDFLREYLIGEKIPGGIWNKLIRADLAKQVDFPVGKIYEDAYYQYDLIQLAETFVVNTKPYYYYFHREGSLIASTYGEKDLDCILVYRKFYNLVQQHYPELKKEAFFRLAHSYFVLLDKLLLTENYTSITEYAEVLRFLKQNSWKIYQNSIFRKGRRIAALVLFVNVRLYRVLLLKNIENSKKNHQ